MANNKMPSQRRTNVLGRQRDIDMYSMHTLLELKPVLYTYNPLVLFIPPPPNPFHFIWLMINVYSTHK